MEGVLMKGLIHNMVLLVLLGSLVVLTTPMNASADPLNGGHSHGLNETADWDRDWEFKEGVRQLFFKNDSDSFTVFSIGKHKDTINSIIFSLDVSDGQLLHFTYFRYQLSEEIEHIHRDYIDNQTFWRERRKTFGGRMDDGRTPLKMFALSLRMTNLYEFNGTEERISTVNLSTVEFTAPSIDIVNEGESIESLTISTGTEDGMFNIRLYFISKEPTDGSLHFGPNEVKFDIEIDGYPFIGDDSYLALENALFMPKIPMLTSPRGAHPYGINNEFDKWNEVGYEDDSAIVFLNWATNVTVDGRELEVISVYSGRIEEGGSSIEYIDFIYPAGDNIFHDPAMGITDMISVPAETEESRFFELVLSWSTGIGVGILVVMAVGMRSRPKKFDWED
jgi:hypothetical protein